MPRPLVRVAGVAGTDVYRQVSNECTSHRRLTGTDRRFRLPRFNLDTKSASSPADAARDADVLCRLL